MSDRLGERLASSGPLCHEDASPLTPNPKHQR